MADTPQTPSEEEKIVKVELQIDDTADNIPSVFDSIEESNLSTQEKQELIERFKEEERGIILEVSRKELRELREKITSAPENDGDDDEFSNRKDRIHALLEEFVTNHKAVPPEVAPALPPAPLDSEKIKQSVDGKLTEGLDENVKRMIGLIFEAYDKGMNDIVPSLSTDPVSRETLKQITFRRNFGGFRMYTEMLTDVIKNGSKTALDYLLKKAKQVGGTAGEMLQTAIKNITPNDKASAKTPEALDAERKKIDSALGHAESMGENSAKDFALLEKFLSQKGDRNTDHITRDPKALTDLMAELTKTQNITPEFVDAYLSTHPAPEKPLSQDEIEKELLTVAGQNNETAKKLEIIMDPKKAISEGKMPKFMEKILEYLQKLLGGILMSLGIDAGAKMIYKKATDVQVQKIMKSKEQGQFETYEEGADTIREAIGKTGVGKKINLEKISGFGSSTDGGVFDFIENYKKNIPTVPLKELMLVMTTEPKTGTIADAAKKLADKYGQDGVPETTKDGKPGISVSRDTIYSAIITGHKSIHESEAKMGSDKDVNTGIFADTLNNGIDWSGLEYILPPTTDTPAQAPEMTDLPEKMKENIKGAIKEPVGKKESILSTDTANNKELRTVIAELRDTKNTDAQGLLAKAGIKAEEIPSDEKLTIGEAHLIVLGIASSHQENGANGPKPYIPEGTLETAQINTLKIKLGKPIPTDEQLKTAIANHKSPLIFTDEIIKTIREELALTEGIKALTEIKDIKLSDITPDNQKKTLKDITDTTGNLGKIKAAVEAIKKDDASAKVLTELEIKPDDIGDTLSVVEALLILRAVGNKTIIDGKPIFDEVSITEVRKSLIEQLIKNNHITIKNEKIDAIVKKHKDVIIFTQNEKDDVLKEAREQEVTLAERELLKIETYTQNDGTEKEPINIPILETSVNWANSSETVTKKDGTTIVRNFRQLDGINNLGQLYLDQVIRLADFVKDIDHFSNKGLKDTIGAIRMYQLSGGKQIPGKNLQQMIDDIKNKT